MSIYRICVHKMARENYRGIEGVAKEIGTSVAVLRNQLTGNGTHKLSVDTAEAIIDVCDSDAFAHAAAQQRSGVFVKLPAEGDYASDLAVLELITHVWRANGDVGRAVDETLADGRVEAHEVAKVRASIYQLQHKLTEMLQRLEGMVG